MISTQMLRSTDSEESIKTHFLTIFTPTYNRAHTLSDVYESLLSQIDSDFEWLIIDDGSTDGTRELIETWIMEDRIPIRYVFQENGGKHIAWNHALSLASGYYFICVDSDDVLLSQAVSRIKHQLQNHDDSQPVLPSLAFLLIDGNKDHYGQDLQHDDFKKCYTDLLYEGKLPSDIWIVFCLEYLKTIPFPEEYRNLYFPESYMILEYDRKYPIRIFNNERLGCYRRDETAQSSLSNFSTKSRFKSGAGVNLTMIHLGHLQFCMDRFWENPKKLFIHAVHYVRFRLHTKDCKHRIIREIRPGSGKLLALAALPAGVLAWALDELSAK